MKNHQIKLCEDYDNDEKKRRLMRRKRVNEYIEKKEKGNSPTLNTQAKGRNARRLNTKRPARPI